MLIVLQPTRETPQYVLSKNPLGSRTGGACVCQDVMHVGIYCETPESFQVRGQELEVESKKESCQNNKNTTEITDGGIDSSSSVW